MRDDVEGGAGPDRLGQRMAARDAKEATESPVARDGRPGQHERSRDAGSNRPDDDSVPEPSLGTDWTICDVRSYLGFIRTLDATDDEME